MSSGASISNGSTSRTRMFRTILFVALDETGSVVGTRGFCGGRWHTPEASLTIPCAEDFAIAHDHRDSGLATAIMRVALEDLEQRGYEYVMNSSGGQITVLHSLAMGWKSVGAMEPVARLVRHRRALLGMHRLSRRARRLWQPGRRARNIYRKLHGGERSSFERLDRVERESSAEPRAEIVVESSPHPAELADMPARIPLDGRIRHVRDAAFFEWRFGNPTREYRFLRYELDGRTEGYLAIAFYSSYAPPTPPFSIVDWEGTA